MWLVILSFVILVSSATAESDTDVCPDNVLKDRFLQVMGSSCYRFEVTQKLEYIQARQYCQDQNGRLVVVKSKAINDFLSDQLTKNYNFKRGDVWIGLDGLSKDEIYRWVDGSKITYHNFADSIFIGPNRIMHHFFFRDCVGLSPQLKNWKDFFCTDGIFKYRNEKLNFVCEFPVKSTTVIPPTAACPFFACGLDCGFDGFAADANGCLRCECDN